MDTPIDLEQARLDRQPHFNWFALCLPCQRTWIATAAVSTSVFGLECPTCGQQKSFASAIPDGFLDQFKGV